ncbi:methyltransferase domain-containing protein [Clostridiaceae bacterium M8S5]|nr:methyltransferase domain-containing protein [Clostridiaceae bacterium M8S5]
MKDRKKQLKQLWDNVAKNFSKIGPDYWDYFGQRLVSLSSIKEGDYVLDVGIGRGSTLFPASLIVGEKGKVTGVDISDNMVSETKKDIEKKKIKNVEVRVMDLEDLDFAENYFDAIVAGFSIGNILHDDSKLNQLLSVLRKSGQLIFSTWGEQQEQQWLTNIVNKYLKATKPTQNKNSAAKLILNTVENLKKHINIKGFRIINIVEESKKVIYNDEKQWWDEMWSNAVSNIFDKIKKQGDFNEFKLEVDRYLDNRKAEEGIIFNMNVIYIILEK